MILSDQQRVNWQDVARDWSTDLSSVQLVDLSPGDWSNTCITSLEVQDGLADMQTPTIFIVRIGRW